MAKVKKPAPPCHQGNVKVFSYPGMVFYGAGLSRGMYSHDSRVDVIISALNYGGSELDRPSKEYFPTYYSTFKIPLPIPTKDGSAPPLGQSDWYAIIEDLTALPDKIGKSPVGVLIYCQGGHGRTGTILAVLHGLLYPDKGDPVAMVRDAYCDRAVETKSQIAYVERMTDLKVHEQPSQQWTSTVPCGGQFVNGHWQSSAPKQKKRVPKDVPPLYTYDPVTGLLEEIE